MPSHTRESTGFVALARVRRHNCQSPKCSFIYVYNILPFVSRRFLSYRVIVTGFFGAFLSVLCVFGVLCRLSRFRSTQKWLYCFSFCPIHVIGADEIFLSIFSLFSIENARIFLTFPAPISQHTHTHNRTQIKYKKPGSKSRTIRVLLVVVPAHQRYEQPFQIGQIEIDRAN